jgi:hypothetical protein
VVERGQEGVVGGDVHDDEQNDRHVKDGDAEIEARRVLNAKQEQQRHSYHNARGKNAETTRTQAQV